MPYRILRFKNGWRVKTVRGKYHSKRPLSLKTAKRQRIALIIAETQ